MGELNAANCFEYSLLCFMLNINLTYYNIIKYFAGILNYSETKTFKEKIRDRILVSPKYEILSVSKNVKCDC